jgi:hypothetical protein
MFLYVYIYVVGKGRGGGKFGLLFTHLVCTVIDLRHPNLDFILHQELRLQVV